MKILSPDTETLKFLREHKERLGQGWTAERANARVFTTGLEAMSRCYQRSFTNMELLVACEDSTGDFTVPGVAALKV